MEDDRRKIMEDVEQMIEQGNETEKKIFLEKLKELTNTFIALN